MTFLYSTFLPALAAAALPVLLHLFSRRRLPLVPFSAVRFLQRLQKKKARRVRLRQILLLILRTAAVAALALVFARPALQTQSAAGSASAVEMVIILDDGLTSAGEAHGLTICRSAAQLAQSLLQTAGSGDQITFISTSRPERTLTVTKPQLEVLQERLEETTPALWQPRLPEALAKADSIIQTSERFNRELYFISDFYDRQWDSLTWQSRSASERRYLIPVGPEQLDNVAVKSVNIATAIRHRGKPVEIQATVQNASERNINNGLLGLYLEGERVAQAAVDLPAGGTVRQDFNIVPERAGKLSGWVKWEEPESFRPDNQRWFTLDIPDSLRILLVGADPFACKVIAAALQSETAGFIRVDQIEEGRWETQSLTGYQGLILAGVRNVSPGQADRIQEFCQRGGGVVIFQDLSGDLAGLSRGLWAKLGFRGAQDIVTSSGVNWGKVDLEHPLFEGMFESGGAPRSPSFRRFVDLAGGKGDNLIIPFTDGKPAMIERSVGQGRALLFAVGLEVGDSDFLTTGIFAPLVFRAAVWASAKGEASSADLSTGRPQLLTLPLEGLSFYSGGGVSPATIGAGVTSALQLHTPEGVVKDLLPKPVKGGFEVETGLIETPGIYDIKSDKRITARLAANIESAQTLLERIEFDPKFQKQAGISAVLKASEADLGAQITSARFGRELWRPLAAAFLGFLTMESLLGGVWGKKEEEE